MVILEALNALAGDCLLLRYRGDGKDRLWIIDGGPKRDGNKDITVWSQVLLPRLKQISNTPRLPVALGMVSHIDDDHINGMQKLTDQLIRATPAKPRAVEFDRFWFNSFDQLVGGGLPQSVPEHDGQATPQSLALEALPGVDDEHASLVMQSVKQGNDLAKDLRSLGLEKNEPVNGFIMARKGQQPIDIDGASVTIVGPLQRRLEALRTEWAEALKKPTKAERMAALQDLFLPAKKLDKSVTNLSSIVVLVEVEGHKLLLTGDAHGDDVVTAWQELELGDATVDLLKMPHHGSIRNVTEKFMKFFPATHYVFSADGKHDNPDAATVEALVKMHGDRKIVMHFTNADVTWEETHKLEKGGKKVKTLEKLIDALRDAYPGPWKAKFRDPDEHSIMVKLG